MGKFIIVEGPDFCGKSTQLGMLTINTWYFKNSFFFTREPGSYLPESSKICEEIREQILNNNNTAEEEANLFAEARYHHTKEIVDLINNRDAVVVSDRYIVSSLAYQAYAQGLDKDMIYELNEPSLRLLRDNNIEIHCIKFTIGEEEWNKRRGERLQAEQADSIEQKDIHHDILEFFSNKDIFDSYTDQLDMQVHEVDAEGNQLVVYGRFLETVRNIINN